MYNVTRAPVAPIDQAPGVPVKGRTGSSALAAALQAHQTASVTTQAYQTAESGKWRARWLETLMCHSDTRQYIWIAAGPWSPGPHWPRRLGNVGSARTASECPLLLVLAFRRRFALVPGSSGRQSRAV